MDTLSLIVFLNPLLKLAVSPLNCFNDYKQQLPIEGSEMLPPIIKSKYVNIKGPLIYRQSDQQSFKELCL